MPPIGSRSLDAGDVLQLQQTVGNQAVQRRVRDATASGSAQTVTIPNSSPFVATIKRDDVEAQPENALTGAIKRADWDAEPGSEAAEVDPQAVGDVMASGSAPDVPEAEEGQTITLPDIVVPEAVLEAETDAVASTLTYAGSVTQSGAVSPFGATSWASFTLTGISVTAAAATFTVRATLRNPITFNVASGGRTNIASETDGALTAANFATAASDLTPNMSDLGGRPPRTQFWAEDLTVRHERFHATERTQFAQAGLVTAQAWLSGQTAASTSDVQTLLNQVPARVIASSQAAMPMPAKEQRAYGDGAALYTARAGAIRTRGAAGSYP